MHHTTAGKWWEGGKGGKEEEDRISNTLGQSYSGTRGFTKGIYPVNFLINAHLQGLPVRSEMKNAKM